MLQKYYIANYIANQYTATTILTCSHNMWMGKDKREQLSQSGLGIAMIKELKVTCRPCGSLTCSLFFSMEQV